MRSTAHIPANVFQDVYNSHPENEELRRAILNLLQKRREMYASEQRMLQLMWAQDIDVPNYIPRRTNDK